MLASQRAGKASSRSLARAMTAFKRDAGYARSSGFKPLRSSEFNL